MIRTVEYGRDLQTRQNRNKQNGAQNAPRFCAERDKFRRTQNARARNEEEKPSVEVGIREG